MKITGGSGTLPKTDCVHVGFCVVVKDGVMVPFGLDADVKHSLKQTGKKFTFSIKDLLPEDAGMYSIDVEGVNIFSTDFKSEIKLQFTNTLFLSLTTKTRNSMLLKKTHKKTLNIYLSII